MTYLMTSNRVSTVREKVREKKKFQGQELSGDFEVGQGILEIRQKVREIMEVSGNFEITSL